MRREDLTFPSGGGACAATLHVPEGDGPLPCVVMANGFSLTKEDGMPTFAERFAQAGYAVLAFDHRHLGSSPSPTPQRFRRAEQEEDWRSAISVARRRPEVDADRIALWGFSFSCSHAVTAAAADPRIAAVMLLCPFLDGRARALSTPPSVVAWITPKALLDLAGRHVRVPVTGQPGEKAAMTLPGEADGFARSVQPTSPWKNEISPGIFATIALHRPVKLAPKVRQPAFVGLGERDVSVSAKAVEQFAAKAPKGELHRYPVDHFDGLIGEDARRIAGEMTEFLERVLPVRAAQAATAS